MKPKRIVFGNANKIIKAISIIPNVVAELGKLNLTKPSTDQGKCMAFIKPLNPTITVTKTVSPVVIFSFIV
ncbi:hypothetical protein ASG22_14725 [Chryseobacterium sp. Leaf405]|nr:hypothetical protein [Chryseobacterium sp. Leaf405]KQT22513.1 hypothetical protein ASG22_14725 [Chryseobacterium sp. Leaf405]